MSFLHAATPQLSNPIPNRKTRQPSPVLLKKMAYVARNVLMGATKVFGMQGGRLGSPCLKYAGGVAARWTSTKRFQESHEYAIVDGDNATVGITPFAAEVNQ